MKKHIFLVIFLFSAIKSFGQNNTNCLAFSSNTDYIDFPAVGSNWTFSQFTVEFWVKITGNNGPHCSGPTQWWMGKGLVDADLYGNRNDDWGITFIPTTGKVAFGIGGSSSDVTIFSAITIADGAWHHIAATWQSSDKAMKLYIDGSLANGASGTSSSNGTRISAPKVGILNLLYNYCNGGAMIDLEGQMDELRFWNTVRDASQILANKDKQINGSMSGLVASYHFNQGTAGGTNTSETTLYVDQAFNSSYNGTLNNFTLSGTASNWVSAGLTLPVTWQSFTATKKPTTVELNWSTASEQNTKDFEVQYSTNTQDWSVLGTVVAAGNSSTTKEYNFTHNSPLKGSIYNYYRIKQNDLDGKYSYSKIVSIVYNEPGPEVQVYPNPVKDIITIYLAESQQLRLVNMAGATVWQGNMAAGRNQLSISHLPKGTYMLLTLKGPQRILIQ